MPESRIAVKNSERVRLRWRSIAIVTAGTVTLAFSGCLGLDVENPNSLNLGSVFNNASNSEAALVGAWRRYFGIIEGVGNNNNNTRNCPVLPLSIYANELTSTSVTYLESSQEPRIPIDNTNTSSCLTRGAWYDLHAAAASGRESYQGIIANGLKYGTVDATTPNGKDTPARLIFGKFLIAISQLQIGLEFDQGFIADAATLPGGTGGQLKPYTEVVANAITQLQSVIADAKAAPDFTLPTTWINAQTITRDDLVRICNSYIIRAEVYGARSPTERGNAPWATILTQLPNGIAKDFVQQADPAIAPTGSSWLDLSYSQNTVRVSNRLIGPADTSGLYQGWINGTLATRNAFTITTPDRRIHGAAGNTTAGKRFTFVSTTMGSSALAPYVTSKYRSNRYLTSTSDSGTKAVVMLISLDEMKFIKAEALYRLGRGQEAADLINPTRIAAGLKAADANGPPPGRDCVPRKDNGDCGDLFDAIQYEKRIELFPYDASLSFADARGWGKLLTGTPIHLPVSGRDLNALGLPYYTFGGGGVGSAP